MSLLSRLREKQAGKFATATPATFASQAATKGGSVASVATVAVAKSPQGQITPPAKVGAGYTVTVSSPGEFSDAYKAASRWWLIHYPERDPVEVACYPEATHAEILEKYPDAIAAEPFTPTIRQTSAPMTTEEETAIRAWLALIEETDPATIAEFMGRCQRDADARDYFTGRAGFKNDAKIPADRDEPDDDRRTCRQCQNLQGWACGIAKPERGALVVANVGYRPQPDTLQRCTGYLPNATDNDQRPGRERWPGLTDTKGTK